MRPAYLFAAALLAVSPFAIAAEPASDSEASTAAHINARDTYYLGEIPQITINDLQPGEVVRVHLFRVVNRWLPDEKGGWRNEPTPMHGWAQIRADAQGRIDLATAIPEDGTSKAVGPATLFWSARRASDPLVAAQAFARKGVALKDDGTHLLRITRGHDVVAERRLRINVERPDAAMTRIEIRTPELSGFFAAPVGARKLPVILHLHGSEGGSTAKARDIAQRYAEAGFATLAINYFAWDYEAGGLPVPNSHRNIPVELLDRARTWLADRPEADTARIALVGNSKGGEFAMVGAATYPWVRAAVGCVPSDVMWEGYGAATWDGSAVRSLPEPGTYSSWSFKGKPLAYIPTYTDRRDGFLDNTDRYDRARAEFSGEARRAHPRRADRSSPVPHRRRARPDLVERGHGSQPRQCNGRCRQGYAGGSLRCPHRRAFPVRRRALSAPRVAGRQCLILCARYRCAGRGGVCRLRNQARLPAADLALSICARSVGSARLTSALRAASRGASNHLGQT